MSILSALYTGVSGLNANGQWLSVIGDNIANVNTIGFKGSVMSFGDILSQSFAGGGGTSQIGRGVAIDAVTTVFSQGTFQTTSSGLDLAIDGEGFFIVNSAGTRAYTRAGNFEVNDEGYIVNSSGAILQGYVYDAAGNPGPIGDLNVLTATGEARATENAGVSVNLNAEDVSATWAFTDGSATLPAATVYNESTATTVYDSLGGAHQVNIYYVKDASPAVNSWTAHYIYQQENGNYYQAGTQNLTFSNTGTLTSTATSTQGFTWPAGTEAGSILFDVTGTTQYSADFSVNSLTQDGYASGDLSNIAIGEDGIIAGTFSNGQTRTLGQVALARFTAPTELTKLGNNLYAESTDSGTPIVGAPESSGLGRILSASLELSTVDLAEQFTQLITAQRGFQANTKIITTTDELLNLLISIKQ
jgi:flagellar hook protein FlgE